MKWWILLFLIISVLVLWNYMSNLWMINGYQDFFERMTHFDLIARGHQGLTPREYKKLYFDLVKPLSKDEVHEITREADVYLSKYPIIKNIEWNLFLSSDRIEGGYPHTLDQNIYIPSSNVDTETLIHEKIHVFQRMYPELTDRLIRKWGFTKSRMRDRHPLQRNNPDITYHNYDYNGWVIFQKYNSKIPQSLASSHVVAIDNHGKEKEIRNAKQMGFPSYVKQLEHPYEIMACMLAHIIKRDIQKNKDSNQKERDAIEWLEMIQKML